MKTDHQMILRLLRQIRDCSDLQKSSRAIWPETSPKTYESQGRKILHCLQLMLSQQLIEVYQDSPLLSIGCAFEPDEYMIEGITGLGYKLLENSS